MNFFSQLNDIYVYKWFSWIINFIVSCTLSIHCMFFNLLYHIAGKFGEFGESSLICQTKTIQISTYYYNLLAESINLPNFFHQMLKTSKFTKLFHCQTSCYTVYHGIRGVIIWKIFDTHITNVDNIQQWRIHGLTIITGRVCPTT